MKIQVFGQEPKDDTLRLQLRASTGIVLVEAVDANGDRVSGGSILSITDRGIVLHTSVGSAIKLPKDDKGRIEVVGA